MRQMLATRSGSLLACSSALSLCKFCPAALHSTLRRPRTCTMPCLMRRSRLPQKAVSGKSKGSAPAWRCSYSSNRVKSARISGCTEQGHGNMRCSEARWASKGVNQQSRISGSSWQSSWRPPLEAAGSVPAGAPAAPSCPHPSNQPPNQPPTHPAAHPSTW